jgi:hypothetical protein
MEGAGDKIGTRKTGTALDSKNRDDSKNRLEKPSEKAGQLCPKKRDSSELIGAPSNSVSKNRDDSELIGTRKTGTAVN